jgi:hypothetical protein
MVAAAIRLDRLIRSGEAWERAAVSRLGRVSLTRVTQIMNHLFLAPDIQEQLLFLQPVAAGRASILRSHLQPLAAQLRRENQWGMWAVIYNSHLAQ